MKNFKLSLLTFILGLGLFQVTAQEEISKGYIKMEITDVSAEDEQMAAGLEMMKGTESEVYFNGKQSVTIMNMMGGMVKMTNHMSEAGDLNMLMDAMGQKMHVESSKLDMDKMKAENPSATSELDYAYDEDDTKEIAGYKCFKMTATVPGEETPMISAYVTEDITASAALIQGVDLNDFRGFPLEFTVTMQGMMSLTTTTVDFKKGLDDMSVFDIKADGYQKMSMEDFMKNAGGGFGF